MNLQGHRNDDRLGYLELSQWCVCLDSAIVWKHASYTLDFRIVLGFGKSSHKCLIVQS